VELRGACCPGEPAAGRLASHGEGDAGESPGKRVIATRVTPETYITQCYKSECYKGHT